MHVNKRPSTFNSLSHITPLASLRQPSGILPATLTWASPAGIHVGVVAKFKIIIGTTTNEGDENKNKLLKA